MEATVIEGRGGSDERDGRDERDEPSPEDEIEVPIDGELDLHTFAPRDVAEVVAAYLDAAREKGIREVRIVHGKGTGFQKSVVERVLSKHPAVRSWRPGGHGAGGWGATLVELLPP